MTVQRAEKVREAVRQEASDIIMRNLKDPRVGFVTVTDVEVTGDLRQVKIFVSVYGDEESRKTTMEGLSSATGFVRSELGKRIRLRHTPEISFVFDESIERGARIFSLLRELDDAQKGTQSDE
ncbi:MAG: 30S ribosome-binding factor RbfA [Limnochordia bacterium]|jgi:ribosome-binding factor A|nr:30S ribosome-binding factor RbfA [Limnochordia bacterium]MDD4518001.1 30S ribosome-binding factor RbfA [Limnochordia bacterium]